METEDVFCRDTSSLGDLNNTMEYVADSLLKIEQSVDLYLDGVKDVLEEQRDAIKEKLDEAEERLSEAKDDLNSCEASQTKDEDGNYTPSCASEELAVQAAREEVEKWRERYEGACRIFSEVDLEIENYRSQGGFLTPPGGKYFIQYLAEEHTDKATNALRDCIDILNDYEAQPANDGESTTGEMIENPYKSDDDKPLTDSEKDARLENLLGKVVDEQAQNSHNIADANRVMKCPYCQRPKALCICGNIRRDMQMINRN